MEPVAPPPGAAVGERVSFLGYSHKILPLMLEEGFSSSLTANMCGDPRGMHEGVEYMYGGSHYFVLNMYEWVRFGHGCT